MGAVIHVDFRKSPPPAPSDDWPAGADAIRIVVRTGKDHAGRQVFDVLWIDMDGARRQKSHPRGVVDDVRGYLRNCGHDVEVVERIGEPLRRAL